MRVLVACEFSGVVRDAFLRRGHDAVSCDILPTESPGPHIQDDVLNHLNEGWDLMIAHPPCTYLSFAAARHWFKPGREQLRNEAMSFFRTLYDAPINKICIENPVGYPNNVFRKPEQIIHPYFFGEPYLKRTCLWLKNLPKLDYSKTIIQKPKPFYYRADGKAIHFTEGIRGNDKHKRQTERSRTFQGIANAMVEQ